MRTAFKEWAIVVDALGRGGQIMILRKGGISEGRGGFKMEHDQFFLFPSLFHQQRDCVVAAAQRRYDEIAPNFPPAEEVRIEYFAKVVEWRKLETLSEAQLLKDEHIWTDQVIAERFEWGGEQAIFAIAVRVYRLARPFTGAMLPQYGGCKSWIEAEPDISTEGAIPVLTDEVFAQKLGKLRARLQPSFGANLLSRT